MDPADSPTEPWTDPEPSRPLPLWASLRQDVTAYVAEGTWGGRRLGVIVGCPGFHAGVLYRLAHLARLRGGRPGRLVSGAIFWFTRHAYFCSIAATARLHGGLLLPEPLGIVIGPEAVVGPEGRIGANVTLGGAPGKAGTPRVGARVVLGRGAVLSGAIAVGDGVEVGPLVVLWVDVPAKSTVSAPASEVRTRPAPGPSAEARAAETP